MAEPVPPEGLLLVDKPAGITSHDVVDRVRRSLGTRKVGHAGTLDPAATGLLLLGVGRATRLLRFLGDLPKGYEGVGLLGVETDTLDADGTVVRERPDEAASVGAGALAAAMAELVGEIDQVPPAHSAVKVGGRKLYEAARAGERLEAAPRRVRVFAFDLVRFDPPRFAFSASVSGGTYIRSLVAEVGARLGCGAHLAALRRVSIGRFRVEDALGPDAPGRPRPVEEAVAHLPGLTLHPEEARVAAHGSVLGPAGLAGPYRVLAPDGTLIGVYRDDGPRAVPEVILASPAAG